MYMCSSAAYVGKKKLRFLCVMLYYYCVRDAICPLHCPSTALTFSYHFVHSPEHATGITRHTITLFVVVRLYCWSGRLWWAVMGYREKPSKMDGTTAGCLQHKAAYGVILPIIVLCDTARRGFNYCAQCIILLKSTHRFKKY